MSKWTSGPPPSIGWWPASVVRKPDVYRWWNGRLWSFAALKGDSKLKVKWAANLQSEDQHLIQWTDRPKSWPARSRT